MTNKVMLTMESRIHGDMYVRFGGRYLETYHRKVVRRWVPSLLKEITDFCGIKKVITSHTARRTFASVVTLANGIPIEMVAKILGHADLRMTMLYTHVFDQNVYNKMININSRI